MRIHELSPEWKTWLGTWAEDLDSDLDVVFYEWDGTDLPDAWEGHPHLAIREDVRLSGDEIAMVWPVHLDGWADITQIGWQGVAELLAQGRRI